MTAPPPAPTLYTTHSSLSFPHSNGTLHPAAQICPDAGGKWNVLAHPSTSPSRKSQILYSFLGHILYLLSLPQRPGALALKRRKTKQKSRRQNWPIKS